MLPFASRVNCFFRSRRNFFPPCVAKNRSSSRNRNVAARPLFVNILSPKSFPYAPNARLAPDSPAPAQIFRQLTKYT